MTIPVTELDQQIDIKSVESQKILFLACSPMHDEGNYCLARRGGGISFEDKNALERFWAAAELVLKKKLKFFDKELKDKAHTHIYTIYPEHKDIEELRKTCKENLEKYGVKPDIKEFFDLRYPYNASNFPVTAIALGIPNDEKFNAAIKDHFLDAMAKIGIEILPPEEFNKIEYDKHYNKEIPQADTWIFADKTMEIRFNKSAEKLIETKLAHDSVNISFELNLL